MALLVFAAAPALLLTLGIVLAIAISPWWWVLAAVGLALTVVALIGALKLPFAELVGFVYPSIGYFGLVFFGMLAYRQISLRLRSN